MKGCGTAKRSAFNSHHPNQWKGRNEESTCRPAERVPDRHLRHSDHRSADPVPAEVAKAKEMLSARSAKADTIQAPRSLAGARQIETPRSQDGEAPRGQNVQVPRRQDVQARRSLAAANAGSSKAFSLVKEAKAACAKGNMATAKAKAEAAIAAMK